MKKIIYQCDICDRPIQEGEKAVSFDKVINKMAGCLADLDYHEKHAHVQCIKELAEVVNQFDYGM